MPRFKSRITKEQVMKGLFLFSHALFAGDAEADIRQLAIDDIWSTDSIKHPSNAVALAALLAEGARRCF